MTDEDLLRLADEALEVCHREGYTTSVAFVHRLVHEAVTVSDQEKRDASPAPHN